MADISTVDARSLFTVDVVDAYSDMKDATQYFGTYFPESVHPTKNLSIEVVRNLEKIAVDVIRGTEGNLNTFGKSTEKIFTPPLFDEFFNLTELDLYDALYNYSTISGAMYGRLLLDTAEKVKALQNKIDRTYEYYRAQALQTGIVPLINGDSINFNRKAASLVDLAATAGGYWSAAVNPFNQIADMIVFIRTVGKSTSTVFDLTLGSAAIRALYANTAFTTRQNLFNLKLDNVMPPQASAEGAMYHGEITAGEYRVRLWSYPQYYTNAAGTQIPYIDPNYGILLPEKPQFKMAYAAVPQLVDPQAGPYVGKFKMYEFLDQRKAIHSIGLKSAGMPITTAVDQVVSFKAV
jgi:hypothetical protein